jgi:alkylation response protein AidB-like acyl-CoA dehydrogenase
VTAAASTHADPSGDIARIGPELARHADGIDRGTVSPSSAYDLIRDTGLPAILVPPSEGGYGLDFADYTDALAELARHNGSAAIGFNMHNVAIGNIFEADPSGFGPDRREGSSFRLDGHKSFVSLAGVADHYVVSARPDSDAEGSEFEVSHFVVSRGDPGVEFTGDWEGSALRGTSTAQMRLHGTVVPAERLYLGVEGMSLFKAVREPHWMAAGYLGAYLGLASAIVDYVSEHLNGDNRRRTDPVVVHEFGRMAVSLEATRALSLRAARQVVNRAADANALIYAAKHHLGETAQTLASAAVRLTGSKSMASAAPMQRLIREVQFCSIMPATPRDCLDYVARTRLGDNMLDVRTQNW